MQRDDRGAARARRRHLVQARHLPELPLQRRGDGRRHDVRTRARIQRHHLDRRVIELGQRGQRQHAIRDDAHEQDGEHQQRRRHRPEDERTRRIHRPSTFALRAPVFALGTARRAHGPRDELDLRPFAQPVRAVDHDLRAGRDPAVDHGDLALRGSDLHRRHGDRQVVLDDVDERSRGAALDRRRRHQRRVGPRLDRHPHVDELVGEERAVGIGELGLELDGARRRVDLVVRGQQPAAAELFLLGPVVGVDRDAIAGAQPLHHARQRILGNRKHDADRLQLRDHDDAVGVRRAHDVAGIHQAQADAAADRGDHAGMRELQLRVVDPALVGLHRRLVLAHQRFLRVDLLPGNRILGEQRAIAFEIGPRVLEQRLVARQLPGGERQLHLERPGVDLGEEIPRLDHLAFRRTRPSSAGRPRGCGPRRRSTASPCRARTGRCRGCPAGRGRRGRDWRAATDRRGCRGRPRSWAWPIFAGSAGR